MTSDPYNTPSDPAKRVSAALTDGPDRAGARAMLKGTGFTDADLAKPIIGVATTWIETMPCNLNQRDLAIDVKRGIRDAGATPMESAITSRETRDARIPDVPIETPSDTAIVLNSIGVAPASRMPRFTSTARSR